MSEVLRENYEAISEILGQHRLSFIDPQSLAAGSNLARYWVRRDFGELTVLLGLLIEVTARLQEIHRRLESVGKGGENATPKLDNERVGLLHHVFYFTDQLRVLLKTLYAWLFHLREDLNSHPSIRACVPGPMWAELERYCTFRSKLVTHKSELQVVADAGIRFGPNSSQMQIFMVPVSPNSDPWGSELSALFERAKPYLQPAESNVENVFERAAILYRGLDKYPGELKAPVKSFIARYGTVSDTPEALSAFIRDCAREVIPKLRPEQ